MRRSIFLALAAAAAALLVIAASAPTPTVRAQAASSVPAVLAGAYRYPHDADHARRIVEAALEPRIATLPSLVQGMARDRIRARLRVARRIAVALDGARVRVTFEGQRTLAIESALGATTTVRNEEGQDVAVRQALRGGWLEQTFEGENGELRQLLSTERLGDPIRYRLDYVREG
jgi:hypothetical protein